jgi:hypothetical protein
MKNDFDKKIKNLLEDANLSDTDFSLDKGGVWDKIEAKKTAKTIPFRKWISHAAALIIGMLICLPFLFQSKKETAQIVTVTKTIATPAQIVRDTVFVVNNSNTTTSKISKNPLQKQIPYTHETLVPKVSQPIAIDKNITNPTTEISTNEPDEATVAVAPKHKLGVLHLLDIENENSLPKSKQTDNYVLFKKISIPSLPNDNSETISMLIAKPASR